MSDNLGKVTKHHGPRHEQTERPLIDNPVVVHGAGCVFGGLIALGIWALVALAAWVFL